MEGGKINLGKSLNRVKFVRPDYLDHCDKFKEKIDESLYRVGENWYLIYLFD